jgi:hypothetical protein
VYIGTLSKEILGVDMEWLLPDWETPDFKLDEVQEGHQVHP